MIRISVPLVELLKRIDIYIYIYYVEKFRP